jgi:hypothetical protein
MYGTETTGWLDVELPIVCMVQNHWMVGCRSTSNMYGTETTGWLDVELPLVCMEQKPLDGWM